VTSKPLSPQNLKRAAAELQRHVADGQTINSAPQFVLVEIPEPIGSHAMKPVPCPVCNSQAEVMHYDGEHYVICGDEDCQTGGPLFQGMNRTQAIKCWNAAVAHYEEHTQC